MTSLPRRFFLALERFNAAHPWDHNAHYHPWIMRQLPGRFRRALDVGSGSGDLARLLATRGEEVLGIDSDPVITARARELTPPASRTDFTVADGLNGIPAGPYDVITCVATLHHLPFSDALTGFRRHLAPGGTLVVVGLFRARTFGDHLLGAAAVPLNAATGWLRNGGRRAARPEAMTARTRPAEMSFGDIVAEARVVLPGARLRRRLFWRYTLVWRRPGPRRAGTVRSRGRRCSSAAGR
ncbi:class I SAM-dependent methyltransferase [Streptomyces sp. NPDC085479]|uniref:class I SAM-dependent methyltransferase n=1 Tax=Streptomyces sp. NPDC085479 TaxID=3365726 RepID=UPI0037CF78F3